MTTLPDLRRVALFAVVGLVDYTRLLAGISSPVTSRPGSDREVVERLAAGSIFFGAPQLRRTPLGRPFQLVR